MTTDEVTRAHHLIRSIKRYEGNLEQPTHMDISTINNWGTSLEADPIQEAVKECRRISEQVIKATARQTIKAMQDELTSLGVELPTCG